MSNVATETTKQPTEKGVRSSDLVSDEIAMSSIGTLISRGYSPQEVFDEMERIDRAERVGRYYCECQTCGSERLCAPNIPCVCGATFTPRQVDR